MSDQTIDPTVEEAPQVQDPASQDPQDQSPKDIRKTITDNYQKKIQAIEAEAEAAKLKAEELQAKLDAKDKTDQELIEESKKKQEELQAQIDNIKRTSEVEKALIDQGISSELRDLITEKAVNLYTGENELSDVIQTIQTQYPSAFKPQSASSVGFVATYGKNPKVNVAELQKLARSGNAKAIMAAQEDIKSLK
jgi:uncharacterized membrane protein YqiK